MLNIDIEDLLAQYRLGVNIVNKLKLDNPGHSSQDVAKFVEISYDIQSGSYVAAARKKDSFREKYSKEIIEHLKDLDFANVLEIGCGEATTLANVTMLLGRKLSRVSGFDISLSRLFHADEFFKEKNPNSKFDLFCADMFNIPLADNSFDLVYSSHSLEPNGGRELEAINELYRVAGKYLLLIEPYYEMASDEGKARMDSHGYVKDLVGSIKKLGLDLVSHGLFACSANINNPTGYFLIRKNAGTLPNARFRCPISHSELSFKNNFLFSKKGGYVYPVINSIPCLKKENGILASHFEFFCK